jgi:YD repeat-containing protein
MRRIIEFKALQKNVQADHFTSFTVDDSGNVTRIADPDGATTEYGFPTPSTTRTKASNKGVRSLFTFKAPDPFIDLRLKLLIPFLSAGWPVGVGRSGGRGS